MFSNKFFSYHEYRKIVEKYQERICDYEDSWSRNEFVLLRHDVEFSVERAYQLAKVDSEYGVPSSFLFQVKSNAYNVLSIQNIEMIKEISEMGCRVGLHLYISHVEAGDWGLLRDELRIQRKVFELATSMPCDRFSFHRPPKWVLENRDNEIEGMINMYGDKYFEYSPKPTTIKYIADSRHGFDYGHPLATHDYHKYHILLHPDEWSEKGLCEEKNFRNLEEAHLLSFCETIDSETKNYAKHFRKM